MGGLADLILPSVAFAGVTLAGYCLYSIIFNLYFHPLAKYPGPLLNRISPLPAIYSLLRGRLPFETKSMLVIH